MGCGVRIKNLESVFTDEKVENIVLCTRLALTVLVTQSFLSYVCWGNGGGWLRKRLRDVCAGRDHLAIDRASSSKPGKCVMFNENQIKIVS